MKKTADNILLDSTFQFAKDIILLSRLLREKREYELSKQLFKSGTSIGANVEESQQGESKRDFVHKLSISLKEAHETRYWLRLIAETKIIDNENVNNYLKNIHSIINLLTRIIKTTKERYNISG